MASDVYLAPWSQAECYDEVQQWIHAEMTRQQLAVTGSIEQIHERPWSIILRVPTSQGDKYFKGSAAALAHEAALTEYLSGMFPDCVPRLLTVDGSCGWMIMEEGGGRLRETLQAQPNLQHWERLLPIMARLQIDAANHLETLLALDVPNRGLARLPQLYRWLTAEEELFRVDLPGGISSQEYRRLVKLQDLVTRKCRQLADYGIPDSLHHGDFHDGNIFYNQGRYLFFDWGDCSVSHPFFTMRTAYVSVENTLGIEEGSPVLTRLRDAYLGPRRDLVTNERLLAAFELAEKLWAISSALNWHRVISSLDGPLRKPYAHVLPSLAQEFLSQIES